MELKIKLPVHLCFYITTESFSVTIYYNIRKLNSPRISVGNSGIVIQMLDKKILFQNSDFGDID